MGRHPRISRILAAVVFPLMLASCSRERFVILSGSENESLEPILKKFASKAGINLVMNYKGSVDIMQAISSDQATFDAVWPASSMWITLGDKRFKLKHQKSIMTSPVVFGIRKSIAGNLDFIGKPVRIADILAAIKDKKLRFAMTSATQSNSGASAYIGFLYALLGNPHMLTTDDLHRPGLESDIKALLSGINRSAGSSGWLKTLFLQAQFDAMVNYESIIIETNRELANQGKEPLYVIYPVDGLALSDSPLCYYNGGDAKKENLFLKLQEYLLSAPVQKEISAQGRRTGLGGSSARYDDAVFNPAWGIDTRKILSPIPMPAADALLEALRLYQTKFRKPSLTAFCLDFSGSMRGEGEMQLKNAMQLLLTPERAREYLLQPGDSDVTVVIPFSDSPKAKWVCSGGGVCLATLLRDITDFPTGGNTDIYSPAIEAISLLSTYDSTRYLPAVILMTDGESNTGAALDNLRDAVRASGRDIPVFSIMFGEASKDQLDAVAGLTLGTVFDGRTDLLSAFKKVKGYN